MIDKSLGSKGIPFKLNIGDILDALPFYVMLVDAEHRILLANRAVSRQLGMEPQETSRRRWFAHSRLLRLMSEDCP